MPQTSNTIHPYHLGASLYMPATRKDIWQVISRVKLPTLNSVIICLEDAVSENDVPMALDNLAKLLGQWTDDDSLHLIDNPIQNPQSVGYSSKARPLVFVRPRNPQMLLNLASMANIDLIDGFVLPKVDMDSLAEWRLACQQVADTHLLMPTLETGRLFDSVHNAELGEALAHGFDERILALRIGGNDLFSALRLRRPSTKSIYETPVGTLMHQLIGTFATRGYYLTAPVCEYFDNSALFLQELQTDVSLGMVGKTIIHPTQIDLVQQAYSVPERVLAEASAILATDAKAVFKFNNTMLEPATHREWALEIVKRAEVFGVLEGRML